MRKWHLSYPDGVSAVALVLGPPAFFKHWVRVVERLEEVGVWRQEQSVFRGEYISSLPTSFPWGWKPRYPERSRHLVCTGQQHKADGALPTPMDLCAPSFSYTAFFTLKNSVPDPWSFESDAFGDLVCSLPSVRSSSWTRQE